MIGKKSLFLLEKLFHFTAFLRLTTYRWDTENFILKSENPVTDICGILKVNKLGWKITNVPIMLLVPYGFVRFLYAAIVLQQKFQDIMFQIFVLVAYMLVSVVPICNLIRNDPLPYLFTLFAKFDRKLTGKYQFKAVKDDSLPYLIYYSTQVTIVACSWLILYLANWNKPVYLTSLTILVPNEFPLIRIAVFIFFTIIEGLLVGGHLYNALTYVSVFIVHWKVSKRWLKEMTIGLNQFSKNIVTSDEMRAPDTLLKIYRQWQINLIVFNKTVDFVLITQHVITATQLILCSFSAIQFWGPQNFESLVTFISYVIFPVGSMVFFTWISMVLPIGADIKIESHKFKFFWRTYYKPYRTVTPNEAISRRMFEQMYFNKTIRSCNELEVEIGKFFSYSKSSMPVTLDNCIDYTITLLVGI